jgi:hypothetical protein
MLAEWIQDKNKDNATALLLIKNFLKESEYNEMHWQKFIETTQSLDKYYNTELINYNPELYNFLTETRLF